MKRIANPLLLQLAVLAMTLLCGAARAQIYANDDRDAPGTLVLSNHASDETPLLLMAAPPPEPAASAAAAPPAAAPPKLAKAPPKLHALIDRVATEQSVSSDLLHAVIAAESNFDASAVSDKGAMGLMQLMPATAQRFGARDPFEPLQNVRAGARYLKWLADLFHDDLKLVLAAYNAGEQSVLRAGGIPNFAETRAYVPRVMSYMRCAGLSGCRS